MPLQSLRQSERPPEVASVAENLSRPFKLRCGIEDVIANSRTTLADSRELPAKLDHALAKR
jgi:hypothetical protein